jgi:hypothetical protein
MEKFTTSTIVKFYNYLVKNPKFKRAEKLSDVTDVGIGAPFCALLALTAVCIYAIIMDIHNASAFDEKHITVTLMILTTSITFFGTTFQIMRIEMVDHIDSFGSYKEIVQLRDELEEVIYKIITKEYKNGIVLMKTCDFSRNIDAIAAILYTISIKQGHFEFYEISQSIRKFIKCIGEDVEETFVSNDTHLPKLENYKKFATFLIFSDIDRIDTKDLKNEMLELDITHRNYESSEISTAINILLDCARIVEDSPRLKANCIRKLVSKSDLEINITEYTKPEDIIGKTNIILNSPRMLTFAGITGNDIKSRVKEIVKDFQKRQKLEKKTELYWL